MLETNPYFVNYVVKQNTLVSTNKENPPEMARFLRLESKNSSNKFAVIF